MTTLTTMTETGRQRRGRAGGTGATCQRRWDNKQQQQWMTTTTTTTTADNNNDSDDSDDNNATTTTTTTTTTTMDDATLVPQTPTTPRPPLARNARGFIFYFSFSHPASRATAHGVDSFVFSLLFRWFIISTILLL
jgi:hypothetical protein